MDRRQEVSHCMTLQKEESPKTLSGPQTTAKRTREVKEITQDHADIINELIWLVNKHASAGKCLYTEI